MILQSAEHINFTYFNTDGKRYLQGWAATKKGVCGRTLLSEPGDGLRVFDRERTSPGYVLFSPDHSNKFLLIDMEGKIVHHWPAWTSHFGYLLPNGHLLLDTEFSPDREPGVVELDWNGNEVWFCPCPVHHDFQRLPNGNTMILCCREIVAPDICPGSLLSSYLIEVTPGKNVAWEWYSEEHTEELKRMANVKFPATDGDGDWTHTNTVQVLPQTSASRDPRFKAGNVLFSHRNLNLIGVIERETGDIVWTWGPGVLDYQHASVMLDNGHIIIFDNGPNRGWSAVREIDPLSGEIVWEYRGNAETPLAGKFLSNAQRLPNGNTFICSGSLPDSGRMLEVTPSGEIVWEFQNPYAEHAQGERIVYRAYKYSPDFIEPLLAAEKLAD